MDPQSMYHYEQPLRRPKYPTPPPSFSGFELQADEHASYANSYVSTPVSPSLVSIEGYESFFTPNPIDDLTSALLTTESVLLAEAPSVDVDDTVAISTAFHLGIIPTPDTIVISADGVIFYVHAQTVLKACPNPFQSYLPAPLGDLQCRSTVIQLDAPSDELNIIMHALYGTSPAAHSPDFETLVRAVNRMPSYDISPKSLIRPSTPLHNLLVALGPLWPIEVYALAAHHDLSSLAITVSSHLLAYNLASITDEMARCIGAIYLKKLVMLHAGRFTSLKEILLSPPRPHAPTTTCGFEDQRKSTRAWALASANLAWEARPDLSTHTIQLALNPLLEDRRCKICRQSLKDRINDVLGQWASVKVKSSQTVFRSTHMFLHIKNFTSCVDKG